MSPNLDYIDPAMPRVVIGGERRAVRVVLVDLDNTLVDRDEAVRAWLRRRGHHGALELVGEGHLSVWTLAHLLIERGLERGRDIVELTREIRSELPELLPPADASRAALDELGARGYRLGLVTNGGSETQRAKLAAAGFELDRFETVCISGEREVAKPSREIFELALAEIGAEPGEALMIGDSPEHDVLGAQGAGLLSCWISRGRRFPLRAIEPDHAVEDFLAAARWLAG